MVISFYPGGGGNRYYNSINNTEYQTLDRLYDHSNNIFGNQLKFRYLDDDVKYEFDDEIIILTHCLNFEKIKYHFPNKTKFVTLDTDFKSSIRRQWCLEGETCYKTKEKKYSKLDVYNTIKEKNWPDINNENELKNLPNDILAALDAGILGDNYYSSSSFSDINSAFSSVCYHRNYYDKYPPTILTAPGIDIIDGRNKNSSEFSKVIISELDRYTSEVFDFAWTAFDISGPDAPVLSMWEDF